MQHNIISPAAACGLTGQTQQASIAPTGYERRQRLGLANSNPRRAAAFPH
jgi:hypothetical protein